ncbi:MAG TPA: DUF6519 domain-containing protein, partial [Longimicrobium sp.]|nr:DUF6519 domain-containing protein [Longimicrobium sp.]
AVDPAKHTVSLDKLPDGVTVADHPRLRPVASFLWAADNASLVYAVRQLDRAAGVAVLEGVGPQGLRLQPGDLVELTDDATVLRGDPGVLRTVRDADPYSETITLDSPLAETTLAAGGRIVLRRWNHATSADGSVTAAALPVRSDGWTALADGVEVRFEGAAFRTADYWTIPVRVAAPNGIEWPAAGKRPAPLPPQGIEHRYAALAVVEVEHRHHHHHDHHHHHHHRHGRNILVEDLRRVFEPLTALTRDELPPPWWRPHDHGEEEVHVTVDDRTGDEIDVTVTEEDGTVEVIAEERDGGTKVDVVVDTHGGEPEEVRVEVVPEEGGGEEIDVVVELPPREPWGEPEEVRVEVHAPPAVPHGCWIFGETPAAPEGFAFTGARLTLPHEVRVWTQRAPLPSPRPGRVQCVVAGGAVFAFADGTREVLRYDPVFDVWEVETGLPQSWRGFAACAVGGAIHLVGGLDSGGDVVDWHQCYDPTIGRWQTRAPLRTPRYDLGAAGLGGLLYAAGGMRRRLFTFSSSVMESYDPSTDTWTGLRSMKHARTRPGVAAARGRIFAVGGGD